MVCNFLLDSSGWTWAKVPHYEYLGAWIDDKFAFKTHKHNLSKKWGTQLRISYHHDSPQIKCSEEMKWKKNPVTMAAEGC